MQAYIVRRLLARAPVTFELGLMSLIIALLVSVPIGVYSATRQDNGGDYVARSSSATGSR